MKFYSSKELKEIGFTRIGKNLEISKSVKFYNFYGNIGSNCRIDDFTMLIGNINIGNHVHVAAYNLISASKNKNLINIEDYTGIGPKCYISCSTEDYLTEGISNPTIEKKNRKKIIQTNILIGKNVLIGAGTYIIPRKSKKLIIGENTSIATKSIISNSIEPNSIVFNNIYKNRILKIKKRTNFSKIKF